MRGNEASERLLARFTPLRANRALGALSPEKMKEFGLSDAEEEARRSPRARASAASRLALRPTT